MRSVLTFQCIDLDGGGVFYRGSLRVVSGDEFEEILKTRHRVTESNFMKD
jgi:hypothetical protein